MRLCCSSSSSAAALTLSAISDSLRRLDKNSSRVIRGRRRCSATSCSCCKSCNWRISLSKSLACCTRHMDSICKELRRPNDSSRLSCSPIPLLLGRGLRLRLRWRAASKRRATLGASPCLALEARVQTSLQTVSTRSASLAMSKRMLHQRPMLNRRFTSPRSPRVGGPARSVRRQQRFRPSMYNWPRCTSTRPSIGPCDRPGSGRSSHSTRA
mmetsp:Transcript_64436/g.179218  ORF Transcript_64436/g.179218 Transcript_64436/m.179218 type:complete len:212 (-) Transcript_64436:2-637(-)